MSRRRNLELLEYHLECASDIMDKENITYGIGLWFKYYITSWTLIQMKLYVHNIRDRVIG
ncbi:MAG: hypothetical protein CVV28_02370 [Methanobacteriales archaeon HGW-Methanobacteriales-1]|jgi:hypothetical protein|nr:MAG: hypothetical protein CVV28_02370 [Methanobacteriales archaeon HGW-Methanobacteriales-1]